MMSLYDVIVMKDHAESDLRVLTQNITKKLHTHWRTGSSIWVVEKPQDFFSVEHHLFVRYISLRIL